MISVGIDVSKEKSMVCMLKPGGEVIAPPYELLHTKENVLKLANQIKNFDEETRVVLEDTGHYHWPIVSTLTEQGIFVTTVNALRMKRFCSQDIRGAKTDRKDAIRIAGYGIAYWQELRATPMQQDLYRELRALSRQYHQTNALLVSAKVNFGNLMDRTMPGIQKIVRDNRTSNRLLDFAERYYHYGNIVKMGERKFTADFFKWAKKQGYRAHERLAKNIFAAAQSGIPVLPNSASTKTTVAEVARLLKAIKVSRDAILTQMETLAKSLPEFFAIREMNCMGDTLTSLLIAEIGDVRRFHSKHALIAYSGIDTPPYQSGSFNATERHISKRGNKYLRKIGYQIMQSYIMHRPEGDVIYEYIQKKKAEGKSGKSAMIAGLNKFLRIYYGKVTHIYNEND